MNVENLFFKISLRKKAFDYNMDINDINKNEDLMLITDNDTFYSIFCVTIKATASGHECVLTFVLFDPKCHPI